MLRLISFWLALAAAFSSVQAAQAPDFSLAGDDGKAYTRQNVAGKPFVLYFMSFKCPHCKTVAPAVNAIHREAKDYAVLGVVFGASQQEIAPRKREGGLEFPLAAGTREIKDAFGLSTVPYFWLLDASGGLEERFSGELGAAALQKNLRSCKGNVTKCTDERVGLYEITEEPKRFVGKEVVTGGILAPGGKAYFPSPRFLLTNGKDKIQVSPWLPIEVAPGPPGFKKRPRPTMSQVLGKYAVVTGVVREGKEGLYIEVKQATASD